MLLWVEKKLFKQQNSSKWNGKRSTQLKFVQALNDFFFFLFLFYNFAFFIKHENFLLFLEKLFERCCCNINEFYCAFLIKTKIIKFWHFWVKIGKCLMFTITTIVTITEKVYVDCFFFAKKLFLCRKKKKSLRWQTKYDSAFPEKNLSPIFNKLFWK